METFLNAAQIAFLGGVALPFVVNIFKRYFKTDPQHLAILIAMVFSLFLVLVNEFAPAEWITWFIGFSTAVYGLGTALYRFYKQGIK